MPSQLRHLYALILVNCQPKNPLDLWEKYKASMSEDYATRTMGAVLAERAALEKISEYLQSMGSSLATFRLPTLPAASYSLYAVDIAFETAEADRLYRTLTPAQKAIVDEILAAILRADGASVICYYVDGIGGAGKSYVYRVIFHKIRAMGKVCVPTASTGIAATLLPVGRTWHSVWRLPVPLTSDSTSSVVRSAELKNADVFILDEAPMLSRYALEAAEKKLRELRESNVPFGGAVILLGGDFRQTLPVLPNSVKSEQIDVSIKSSRLWPYFKVFTLHENIRLAPGQEEFAQTVLDIGNGKDIEGDEGPVQVPAECRFDGNLEDEVYGEFLSGKVPAVDLPRYLRGRNILCVRNESCDEYNHRLVDRMQGELYEFHSVNVPRREMSSSAVEEAPPETLGEYNPMSLQPHVLRIKKGCPVIVIRNLDVKNSLCNGTRLIVTRVGNRIIEATHMTEGREGQKVWIPRITLQSNDPTLPVKFDRTQFPVRVALSLTLNKSQGQTFEFLGADMTQPAFAHGQTYVLFSRVRRKECLRIYDANRSETINNVVYKEIIQD